MLIPSVLFAAQFRTCSETAYEPAGFTHGQSCLGDTWYDFRTTEKIHWILVKCSEKSYLRSISP